MKILKYLAISLAIMAGSANATLVTSRPASTSDDYAGYRTDSVNFASGGNNPDSVATGPIGRSGAFFYYRIVRFPNLTIPQGSTIDSAFWVTYSGCSGCTDSLALRVVVYNADNGIQVTDTAGVRTTFAAKATASGTQDTAYVNTTTAWSLNTPYRIPFTNLKGLFQNNVSRSGWSSGNSVTLMLVGLNNKGGSNRGARLYDNGTTVSDSVMVYYSAASGGGGGATPNTVIRGATVRGSIIRAPEKMFRREESWKW